jgi:hypothetical protein
MAIGIIKIDLHHSKSGFYDDSTQEIIDKYLSGDDSLETINSLIAQLADDELIYFTEEDFPYSGLSRTMYSNVSQDTYGKLQRDQILPLPLKYSKSMYGNFKYENNKFIHPAGEDKYLDINLPCMVYFDKDKATFFILSEDGDAGII